MASSLCFGTASITTNAASSCHHAACVPHMCCDAWAANSGSFSKSGSAPSTMGEAGMLRPPLTPSSPRMARSGMAGVEVVRRMRYMEDCCSAVSRFTSCSSSAMRSWWPWQEEEQGVRQGGNPGAKHAVQCAHQRG